MNQKTFYEILEVSPNASDAVIRAAYKSLAQRHHPDRNGGSAEAEETLKRINLAFEALSDPERRKQYDEALASECERQQETREAAQPAPGRAAPQMPLKAGGRLRKIVIFAAVCAAVLLLVAKWRAIASVVSWLFIIAGGLAALGGAGTAFYTRKVDRRYKTGYRDNERPMPFAQRLRGFGVMLAGLAALGISLSLSDANKSGGDQARPAEGAQALAKGAPVDAIAGAMGKSRGQEKTSGAMAGASKGKGAAESSPAESEGAADNSAASAAQEPDRQLENGRFSEDGGSQTTETPGASGLPVASTVNGEYLYKGRMPSGRSGTWMIRYVANASGHYRVVLRSPEDDRSYYEAYCEAPCDFYRLDQYADGALVQGIGLVMDRSVLPGRVLADAVAGRSRIDR